ncbi:helix-turn-helix domain-containing protein [Clostridioides difficile]|uniref:helix-turn-helix domain-containing protein n=1 Tax=Clostridioides difficile TaxID=1496 RepID=UPI00017F4D5C|nr:helix-turn-helix transcriptional regulator [Clostridioides difficile]EQG75634.1 helix-turn-helix family protein [Clostridioides difficile DA00165]OFU10626.1 transcriptional regulator [Clostridium sp. HMSC19D07]OFU10831.1 transcriptional regulator [Clostridium sp. HMSC19C11]AXU53316.1 transcriptional regulator [Clostridioides difficile]EAA0010241.1 XRE family transcriptional regulator [Clostridioides difficile]
MSNETISTRIRKIRKDANLSQPAFGEKLGVSKDVISNIEYNRVEPKPLFINYMCDVFNVNKEWLLNGVGNMYISTEDDILLGEAFAYITTCENEKLKKIVINLCKLEDIYVDAICTTVDGIISDRK